MPRQEKDFQSEFSRSLRLLKDTCFYHKIVDTGIVKNPFDCFVVYHKRFYALELKICKSKNTFNFNTFFRGREHELDCLERAEKAGAESLVLINHFIPRVVNKVYVLPIKIARLAHNLKKGLKTEDIAAHCKIIEKIPHNYDKLWDLRSVIV